MEFHGNHGELTSWLEEAESHLDQMEARAGSSEAPLVSPVELLTDAKVTFPFFHAEINFIRVG